MGKVPTPLFPESFSEKNPNSSLGRARPKPNRASLFEYVYTSDRIKIMIAEIYAHFKEGNPISISRILEYQNGYCDGLPAYAQVLTELPSFDAAWRCGEIFFIFMPPDVHRGVVPGVLLIIELLSQYYESQPTDKSHSPENWQDIVQGYFYALSERIHHDSKTENETENPFEEFMQSDLELWFKIVDRYCKLTPDEENLKAILTIRNFLHSNA